MGFKRPVAFIISLLCLAAGPSSPAEAAGTVYVVHAIDTESRFLQATRFHQALDLRDFMPGEDVDSMMSAGFRDRYRDSFGRPIVFSWFVLTQSAYRHDSSGRVTEVYDALHRFAASMATYGDVVGWHYHHVAWSASNDTVNGQWEQLTTFTGSNRELPESELAELMVEKGFYPTVFRAGFTWENTDFSNWLDSLIPFDFSNLAPMVKGDTAKWHYDWSRAPSDWSSYHPSRQDYQFAGDSKHLVLRCVPGLGASALNYGQAFAQAAAGHDVVVAAYTHNFNDVWAFCHTSVAALHYAAEMFPGVKYQFVNALTAARVAAGLSDTTAPQLTVSWTGDRVLCQSNEPLYADPVCAVLTADGVYRLLRAAGPTGRKNTTAWQFGLHKLRAESVAVGGCDPAGNAALVRIDGPLAQARVHRNANR